MAKININFNDSEYSIDESSLSAAIAALQSHLSTKMNGTGAVINLGETSYNIDSTKLSTATNAFVSHLGTIAGSGHKVKVGGVEYGVDSTKVAGAVSELETVLGDLTSGSDVPDEGLGVDPATGEILDSWEQIIDSINDGTYAKKYAIGNYKPLDLGSEGIVNMQIAALDADVLSDGSGNARVTWIAKELLATKHVMNGGGSLNMGFNDNGWEGSEMRTYLSEDIYALIPTIVQNAIVSVDKTYYDYTTKSTLTCSDKVWIPSYREVCFGTDVEDSGVIYSELFADISNRFKTYNGSDDFWWLRSAYASNSFYFYYVQGNGSCLNWRSDSNFGVALAFCMGGTECTINGHNYSNGVCTSCGMLEPRADPVTGEILDSWEQIIDSINDGTYAKKYAIGNYKPLDLGSEGIVNMQIAALDDDVLSDGSGDAHITWIAKELLATKHVMNSEDTNANGWEGSEMRTYLSEDIYALIPTIVQNAIVSVDKTYYDYTTKSTLTCSDKVWIPSYREVGSGTKLEDSGVIYRKLFTDDASRTKTYNGSDTYWWLRSAAYQYAGAFCYVTSYGDGANETLKATYACPVALGFCM